MVNSSAIERSTASYWINNHFGTVSTSGTTCQYHVYRQNVYVGLTLRSIMPFLVQEVDLLLSDTTRFRDFTAALLSECCKDVRLGTNFN